MRLRSPGDASELPRRRPIASMAVDTTDTAPDVIATFSCQDAQEHRCGITTGSESGSEPRDRSRTPNRKIKEFCWRPPIS